MQTPPTSALNASAKVCCFLSVDFGNTFQKRLVWIENDKENDEKHIISARVLAIPFICRLILFVLVERLIYLFTIVIRWQRVPRKRKL